MIRNFKQLNQMREGFTVVELLIVIVVIGILATLTIVSYSGVTADANDVKAQSAVSNIQKVAEAYNADNGVYPGTIANFTDSGNTALAPASITILRGPAGALTGNVFTAAQFLTVLAAPLAASADNVIYSYEGASAATATGGVLVRWDYSTGAESTDYTYLGNSTSASTFVQPAA